MKVYKRANPFDESSKEGNSEIIQPEIENIQEVNLVRFDVNTEDEGLPYHKKAKIQKPSEQNVFKNMFACISIWLSFKLAIIQTGCFVFKR